MCWFLFTCVLPSLSSIVSCPPALSSPGCLVSDFPAWLSGSTRRRFKVDMERSPSGSGCFPQPGFRLPPYLHIPGFSGLPTFFPRSFFQLQGGQQLPSVKSLTCPAIFKSAHTFVRSSFINVFIGSISSGFCFLLTP